MPRSECFQQKNSKIVEGSNKNNHFERYSIPRKEFEADFDEDQFEIDELIDESERDDDETDAEEEYLECNARTDDQMEIRYNHSEFAPNRTKMEQFSFS